MRFVLLVLALFIGACAGARPPAPELPPVERNTTLGPGDLLQIEVVGEKDLPKDYQVFSDGTIEFPYLDKVAVAGLEPQAVVETIKSKLKDQKILVDPKVTLVVKAYASKAVSIIGQVQKPGSIAWSEGITLLKAVSQVGGFTQLANSNQVILIRQSKTGKSVRVLVSVDAIMENQQPDIPLQAGDTIKVEQRAF
ncbi:MAG: polysaccharide biosynthesis/export family protein [Polyangiaceae bacterium]